MAFIWLKHLLRPRLKTCAHPKISTYVTMSDPQFDGNGIILEVSVKSMWIKHGALAGLGSIFTYPTVGQAIKHHWTEVRTDNGLYSVQFHGGMNSLFIHKKHSREDIVKEATNAAGMNQTDTKKVSCVRPVKSIKDSKTMEEMKTFVESYALLGKYDLVLNNCQDFSAAIYKWCT